MDLNFIQNSKGRLAYLFDWLNPSKWHPKTSEGGRLTRVIKQWDCSEYPPPHGESRIVKVVINPSQLHANHWSPILEVNKKIIFLGKHAKVPFQPDEWYNCLHLAKMAAFEFLWPTDADNWDGREKYFDDVDYDEYSLWRGDPTYGSIY